MRFCNRFRGNWVRSETTGWPPLRGEAGAGDVRVYFFAAKSQTVQLQYMPPAMPISRLLTRLTTRVGLPHSGHGASRSTFTAFARSAVFACPAILFLSFRFSSAPVPCRVSHDTPEPTGVTPIQFSWVLSRPGTTSLRGRNPFRSTIPAEEPPADDFRHCNPGVNLAAPRAPQAHPLC